MNKADHINRKDLRALLMQHVFEAEANGDFSAEFRDAFLTEYLPAGDESGYFNEVWEALTTHMQEIDTLIQEASRGWKINRIGKVDLAVLRISIAEFIYTGLSEKISINEAVELAKKYSDERSGRFVNGILGTVYRGWSKDKDGQPEEETAGETEEPAAEEAEDGRTE